MTPASITDGQVWLLGVGSAVGIGVQAAVLLPALRRVGVPWRWRWDWRGARLGSAGRLAGWVLLDCLLSQAGFLVIMAVANAAGRAAGNGSTVFANANLLLQVPYGVLAVALLTVLLPRLSRAAAAGRDGELRRDLALGTRLSTIALLPASGLLIAVGPALSVLVFDRGAADPARAQAVGVALAWCAFALLPEAVSTLQRQAFYATRDGRTPAAINAVMVAVRIPAALACGWLLPAGAVVAGLGVALGLSYAVGAIAGAIQVRRRFGVGAAAGVPMTLVRTGLATGLGTVLGYLAGHGRSPLLAVAIGAPVTLVVTVLGLFAVRLPEARSAWSRWRRPVVVVERDDDDVDRTRSGMGTFTT